MRQVRAVLRQRFHSGCHQVLLALRKFLPPLPKLIRVLNLPRYTYIIFHSRNGVRTAAMSMEMGVVAHIG